MTLSRSSETAAQTSQPPLPVTIVPGMYVYDITELPKGEIVAVTQAYCVFRFSKSDLLCVADWRDVALDNLCPAAQLLPGDVTDNDKRNVAATALRELLALKQVGSLTAAQSAALDELRRFLCGNP